MRVGEAGGNGVPGPLLELIEKRRGKRGGNRVVVAIDGPCASGKTTLAERLSEATGAGIVHMDDFFLPLWLRTDKRLSQPGGNVHYERFLEEVVPALRRGEDFTYRRFDCGKMELSEERKVCGRGVVLVEGTYSCHPKFGEYMDVRVFCQVEPAQQLRRIERRNGSEALEVFKRRWIPLENVYLETYPIRDRADFLL